MDRIQLSRNQDSIMLEDCGEFTSLIHKTKDSKKPQKNAHRKLEISIEAEMPCKITESQHSSPDLRKTNFACVVEADESTRRRLEGWLPKDHEDHHARKGINSLNHDNLAHKFSYGLKQRRFLKHKAAVDKNWIKLDKISAWQLTKVTTKK